MKRTGTVIVIGGLLFHGCVKTVTRQDLDAAVAVHDQETVNWVSYAGSAGGCHYLRHGYTLGSTDFRVAESELHITNPFPLTRDRTKWRPLKENWKGWQPAKADIGNPPHAARLPLVAPASAETNRPAPPRVGMRQTILKTESGARRGEVQVLAGTATRTFDSTNTFRTFLGTLPRGTRIFYGAPYGQFYVLMGTNEVQLKEFGTMCREMNIEFDWLVPDF